MENQMATILQYVLVSLAKIIEAMFTTTCLSFLLPVLLVLLVVLSAGIAPADT